MDTPFQFEQLTIKDNDVFPEQGLFTDLPADVYHDLEGRASSSVLRTIHNKTPAHAKAQIDDDSEPTSAMRFGTMTHEAVLEPARFEDKYAVSTQCMATTSSGSQCKSPGKVPWRTDQGLVLWSCGRDSHQPELNDPMDMECPYCGAEPGDRCVTDTGNEAETHVAREDRSNEWDTVDGTFVVDGQAEIEQISESKADKIDQMLLRLKQHPTAYMLLFDLIGLNEATIVFTYSDDGDLSVPAKARIDRIVQHDTFGLMTVDYKTTRNAQPGPHEFGRSIERGRYDMQGEFYMNAARSQGIPARAHAIVAQEKEPPYAVSVQVLPGEGYDYVQDNTVPDLQAASEDVKRALRQYVQCVQTGNWPAYPDSPTMAEVPAYADAGTFREDR
jgi:hypothetical protein